jgi:gamma-glutamyltranspeptidase/glutathione hydrolase
VTPAGAVACPEPAAADAAVDALGETGSAIDAAIAGAFAQAVTNPLGTGIGGMAHIMLLAAGQEAPVYLNASVETGSQATTAAFSADFIGRSERAGRYLVKGDRNQLGYQSIMTPGFVRGMSRLQADGRASRSWEELVRPAVRLAEEGFAVDRYLADYFTFEGPSRPGYPDIFEKLADADAARATYLPDGRPMSQGEKLSQPDYGRTLDRIARKGADDFYDGEIGSQIAEDWAAHGALVTADDLGSYAVRVEAPVSSTFRDLQIYSAPPPSHGIVLLMMLGLAEEAGLESLDWNGPEYVDQLARITRTAFAECLPYLADPRFVDVPTDWLLSKSRIATIAPDELRTQQAAMSEHTTHISACDSSGNFVSITHSIGSVTGAGVMTPDLGFFHNNFLGHFNVLGGYHDSITPGKRMGGGCPSIVYRNGKPWLAIGSSGGPRLISGVFQTLLNLELFGMSLQDAVAAPRIHCEERKRLYIEPAFAEATRRQLAEWGYELTVTGYMGCNQAVALTDGDIETGSDPRGGIGIGRWLRKPPQA